MKINIDDVIKYKEAYKLTCENIKRNNGSCDHTWCKKEICPWVFAECEEELSNSYIKNISIEFLNLFCSSTEFYFLGEEVEVFSKENSGPEKAKVGLIFSDMTTSIDPRVVRKLPTWEPKDGEPVLFNDEGKAMAGFIKDGVLFARGLMIKDWKTSREVSKFTNCNDVGKPWKEVYTFDKGDIRQKLNKAIKVLENICYLKPQNLYEASCAASEVLNEIR